MNALLVSTLAVAIAEIGDKTQLLSLLLAARYRRPWLITGGIAVATIANHALAAWLGGAVSGWLPPDVLRYALAASFVLMGLWLLIPDDADDVDNTSTRRGAFTATLLLFFLAEMGDKTQIATVALGARFDSVVAVATGTTLGMLLANVPVVFGGDTLMRRIPMVWVHRVAAVLFIGLGLITLMVPLSRS